MYCSSFESADSIKSENPEPLAGCWLLNIYSTAWCWHWVKFPTRSAGLSTLLLQQSRAYAEPFVTQNPTVNIASMNSIWWCSLRDIYIFYTYLPSSPLPLKIMLGGGGVWMWWVWAITSQCLMLLQIQDGAMFQVWSSYFWSLLSQAANREVSGLEGLVNVFLSVFFACLFNLHIAENGTTFISSHINTCVLAERLHVLLSLGRMFSHRYSLLRECLASYLNTFFTEYISEVHNLMTSSSLLFIVLQ